jgi:4-amino-4-deoxy-L-arabinose transferase-like glycosyltransferase
MKPRMSRGTLSITVTLLFWLFFATRVPTFDFDESLYRRVADSMREHQDPWLMTWDDRALHHKPPIFYWLIWASSSLIDWGKNHVSSLAARIPSLLASIGILYGLHRGMRFILDKPETETSAGTHAVSAFLSAAFPVLTAIAVIFDPVQSLALLPAILIPTRIFHKQTEPRNLAWFGFGGSLALATGIKGLNGFVIPCLALGIQMLLQVRTWGWKRVLKTSGSALLFGILPALILCLAWFGLLHQKIGPEFTREFFWVQHLGRSRSSMEDHSGGWYYHACVLFFGSGFLSPLLIRQWRDHSPDWLRVSYPAVFALSFVFFFSLSATKLPHYLWPAWPALAVFSALLVQSPRKASAPGSSRVVDFLASIPVTLLGGLLFALALAPDLLLLSLPRSPQSIAILSHWEPFSFLQKSAFLSGGVACLVFQLRRTSFTRNPELTALCSVLALFSLCLGLLPSLERIAIRPFVEIAGDLKKIPARRTDCIRYSGAFSATLSLALAPELIHNRCEPEAMKYLISPEWKAEECAGRGLRTLSTRSHLVLCGKP